MRASQRVLVLGGTGSIGGALVQVLRQRGHHVTCLARSQHSEDVLRADGFDTIRGDVRALEGWINRVPDFDAVIQAAAIWADDAETVDRRLTGALLRALATPGAEKTLIYTDGCWSYGGTGDAVATEETPFDPLPSFVWSGDLVDQVLSDEQVRGMVILPAMVYERDGGVLETMVEDARNHRRVRIVGDAKTRWTLVHRMDLAQLYALMLERGDRGARFNGAGITSMPIGKIARALAHRFGGPTEPEILSVPQALKEIGPWADGYALDQQMSGKKRECN